jgi:hypothetical protein
MWMLIEAGWMKGGMARGVEEEPDGLVVLTDLV